ncbi:MAG TPA: hypothetical protein DC049_19910 [Spirochaetia bacterium]|nr:hypothetical protein [Spirochaetia bacterium]
MPPTLIASSVAGMLGGFLGYIASLSENEKNDWADYIKSFQNQEGWFEDTDINDENRLEWYGRDRALFHRTRHALSALYALGGLPARRFKMTQAWYGAGNMKKWLESLDLSNYWYASNMMMDAYLLLSHEYNYYQENEAARAIEELLNFCDETTNPHTGYHDRGLSEVRNAMAGAMHLYPVYFLSGRKPKYPEAVIKTTLSLQQPDGLFAYQTESGGEDCLDYDAVLILCNFYFLTAKFQKEIKCCFQKCLQAVMINANPDGGFSSHRRPEIYNFGTKKTLAQPLTSNLWATYSRLLLIAMIHKILSPQESAFQLGANLMEVWNGGTEYEK